jgi:hypothetical protein
MAEGVNSDDNSRESCERNEVVEKSCACNKCLELELQLKGALLEQNSVQLIIEMLWKGENVSTCSEFVSNSTSTTYEDVDLEVNNNGELVNSRHSSEPKKLKEPRNLLTFPNS